MENSAAFRLFCCMYLFIYVSMSSSMSVTRKTYIIHVDKSAMPAPFTTHHNWYLSTLSSLSAHGSVEHEPTHLYTYNHVIDGFSAVLSESQLAQLEKNMPGHLATYPETFGHLHTTHTPKFLGLNKHVGLWPAAGFGDDMIIGIIDTGIWPESESFSDKDMPPVPERWRGECEAGTEFNSSNCNRKLIGARSFSRGMKQLGPISKTDDYDSPRDFMGHGTHTSSTAAGSRVQDADYFGYAKGSATGIAPMARVAMYKVLFFNGSYEAASSDTLAGMDQAIADGVDLMSLSLGFFETPFDQNPIAIGAFAALRKGIFVSCSAGNAGPHAYTIFNGAPWITTVAAGTVDRQLSAQITIGDSELTVTGKSAYPENLFVSRFPIYYGHGNRSKEICSYNAISPLDVDGKYIFCDFDETDQVSVFEQLDVVDATGAKGAIFSSDSGKFVSVHDFVSPFVIVVPKDGDLIKDLLIKNTNTTVDVKFQKTILGTKPAPQVAYFSSRGPDRRSPWILKPDMLAPGVDILAAWVPNRAETPIRDDDYLVTDYALVSGTSMASPHIIGIAALLKSVHKDWSSAAIRSAMMTTADVTDNTHLTIIDMTSGIAGTPLDYGAGHINPNRAMDPGLIYDIQAEEYVNYLCGLNYTTVQIKTITGISNFKCGYGNLDLNYPSFIVILNNTNTTSYTFKRVLTNVVDSNSSYRVVVKAPVGMDVFVKPETITFTGKYSKAEFKVSVVINLDVETRGVSPESDYIGNFGYLTWFEVNGKHTVRSPIVSAFAP